MAMQRTTYLSGGLPGVVLSGSTALVLLYGGQRVIDGTLTPGTLVAFMAFQLRLFGPIQALMGLYTSLATVRVSLGRVHEILDVAPEVVEAAAPVSLSTARGELALDDVSFSFERGAPVLEHVSLRVAPDSTGLHSDDFVNDLARGFLKIPQEGAFDVPAASTGDDGRVTQSVSNQEEISLTSEEVLVFLRQGGVYTGVLVELEGTETDVEIFGTDFVNVVAGAQIVIELNEDLVK